MSNRLMEAVKKEKDLDWQQDFMDKARGNAFYKRVMKEGVLSDMSQALGQVYDVAVEAATKMQVARDIIWFMPTKQPTQRFYLAKRGAVTRVGETGGLQIGERFSKVDIDLDYEYVYNAAYTQSYIEDVPFDVLRRAIADGGQLLEEKLTSDVMVLYESVAAGSLAGAAEITAKTAGTLAWADLVAAWTALNKESWKADVCIVHPDQYQDLWNDDKFIHSYYFGDAADVARGILGSTYLGFKIVVTDLCTTAQCHMLASREAAACLMRRDIMTQPYEIPDELREGVLLSRRYGLGTLKTTAIARIVSC